MMERYTLENLKKVFENPGYVGWELQRILFDLKHRGSAIDVMSEDWDNLILLDACRYDYFEDQNTIPGELSSVISHGGSSWEFMEGNFVGQQFHDTVYVTANPHTGKLDDDVFHTVEPLYVDAWSDEHGTVLPEDVVEATLSAHESYPNKRLVVHFMQPHRPYLGEIEKDLQRQYNIGGFNRYLAYTDEAPPTVSFSKLIENGEIPVEKAQSAYRETLDIVLNQIEGLVDRLPGKSVVSADHGEMLGERIMPFTSPKFGHSHQYIRNETLYRVPWLEIPTSERREVIADEPIGGDSGNSAEIQERLQALGYK
jgi:hypothetical protein